MFWTAVQLGNEQTWGKKDKSEYKKFNFTERLKKTGLHKKEKPIERTHL